MVIQNKWMDETTPTLSNSGIHRDRHPDQGLGGGDRRAEVAVQGDEAAHRRLRLLGRLVPLVLGAQVHGGVRIYSFFNLYTYRPNELTD